MTGHPRSSQRELEGEAELQKARTKLQEKISAAEDERVKALEEQSGLMNKVHEADTSLSPKTPKT